MEIIHEICPEYDVAFDIVMNSSKAHRFNMFIMKKDILDGYCNWLFGILFELEKRVDASQYDSFHARFFGRVSELLLDVYINTNKITYTEQKLVNIEKVNWWKKGMSFLKAKFTGKKYGKSF